jgi:hypothetical protein
MDCENQDLKFKFNDLLDSNSEMKKQIERLKLKKENLKKISSIETSKNTHEILFENQIEIVNKVLVISFNILNKKSLYNK